MASNVFENITRHCSGFTWKALENTLKAARPKQLPGVVCYKGCVTFMSNEI